LQHKAIARTIFKNAPILFCDEATSALDTNTVRARFYADAVALTTFHLCFCDVNVGTRDFGAPAQTRVRKDNYHDRTQGQFALCLALSHAVDQLIDGSCCVCMMQLNTVMNADKIVVLSDGVVAESGSHDELLEHNGIYAGMWNMQHSSEGDVEEATDDRAQG